MPTHRPAARPNLILSILRLLVMALCLTVPALPAAAQGTMGTVPDPISSRELEGYADRLGLSPQQRQAVQSLHDQYREAFTQLRDTDIEKFLNDSKGLGGGGGMAAMGMMTDRKAVEKALKGLEDIHNKIKNVDNTLFDQMQPVLTEEQTAKMTQVRQARERVRYRSGLSRITAFMNPAAQVDLSEFVADLHLTPQEKEVVDPTIAQYESTLTSDARKLFESTSSMMLDALDQLQKQGMNEAAMRDPEQRGQLFQVIRTVMGDIQKKLAAKAGALSDLNRRTLRTVAPSLTPEHARDLRDQYYQRAYPEISAGKGTTARAFDIVLKFPELTDEQRQAITVMATEYFASLDRLAEQAMDAIDGNRSTQSFFDFDQESRRKFQEQLTALRDKRSTLNESSSTSLRAALTPELVELLNRKLASNGKQDDVESQTATLTLSAPGGGPGAISVARVAVSNTDLAADTMPDPYVPGAISKRDVETIAKNLGLTSDEKNVLHSLHQDYMEKFNALEADETNGIKAVRESEKQLWAMDAATGQLKPRTPEAIDHLYSLRRQVFDAVMALDQHFFDDASVAMAESNAPKLKRAAASRQRDLYVRVTSRSGNGSFFGGQRGGGDRGPRGGGGPGGDRGPRGGGPGGPGGAALRFIGGGESGESSLDLTSLVDSLPLSPSDQSQFDSTLTEYSTAALASLQKLYDATLKMGAAREKMTTQFSRGDGNREGRTSQVADSMRSMMENEGRASSDARKAFATLNKSTLDRLLPTLPSGQAQTLRQAYYKKAFPSVFNDPRSADPHLDAALTLGSLTDQQRSQIQEIAVEFHGQYDSLCEKLIEMEANASDLTSPNRDPAVWQTMQEQMRTREKIEFDRNDLNDKTLGKLRSALNEQQIQQLGGLQPKTENG